jgi:hypothetical protein
VGGWEGGGASQLTAPRGSWLSRIVVANAAVDVVDFLVGDRLAGCPDSAPTRVRARELQDVGARRLLRGGARARQAGRTGTSACHGAPVTGSPRYPLGPYSPPRLTATATATATASTATATTTTATTATTTTTTPRHHDTTHSPRAATGGGGQTQQSRIPSSLSPRPSSTSPLLIPTAAFATVNWLLGSQTSTLSLPPSPVTPRLYPPQPSVITFNRNPPNKVPRLAKANSLLRPRDARIPASILCQTVRKAFCNILQYALYRAIERLLIRAQLRFGSQCRK